jgi:pilus assembly protein Flp/PilA
MATIMEQSFRGTTMKNLSMRLLRDKRGATAIEYGLIVAFIALAIMAAATQLGEANRDTFTIVSTKMGQN